MRINCPYCGERDASEFTYLGDASPVRPDATPADPPLENDSSEAEKLRSKFYDYVYLRENVAGFMHESWYHGGGCRAWLTVERNTVTHEIRSVETAPGVGAASVKPRKRGRS